MRNIIDATVKEHYNNRPFSGEEFRKVCSQFPGEVEQINLCAFINYKSIKPDSIMEQLLKTAARMPGKTMQDKYKLAMISHINLGSLYQSIAVQYALYTVLTSETRPQTLKGYLIDAGYPHLVSTLDFNVIERIIDDVLQGYKLCDTSSDNTLAGLAESFDV